MEATVFTPTQQHLLKMFAYHDSWDTEENHSRYLHISIVLTTFALIKC